MAAEKPVLGHVIEIGGEPYKVHCDCKDVRDELEKWVRAEALAYVDKMFKEGLTSKEEYAANRLRTLDQVKAGEYSYGSSAFANQRTSTDAGVKRDLYERIRIEHPKVSFDLIAAWVDEQSAISAALNEPRWASVFTVFNIADGFCPKAGPPATGG